MDCDFPAAHSMDTTWFAVDRDGHVGQFDSWEAGAVPRSGFQHSLMHEPPTTEVIVDYAGRQQPWSADESAVVKHLFLQYLPERQVTCLVFLKDDKESREWVRAAGGKL